jgi:hypothetical protein
MERFGVEGFNLGELLALVIASLTLVYAIYKIVKLVVLYRTTPGKFFVPEKDECI